MTYKFLEALTQKPLLCDGAMGTMIYTKGIPFEHSFDELNLSRPALIAEIHRSYIEAGAEIIQTNTFGANRFRLAEYGLENKVADINRAGVWLARRVVDASFKSVFVAGTVGPLGQWLAPLGRLNRSDARSAFAEQIGTLIDAGADLLIFDTFADLNALIEAVQMARDLSATIPLVTQVTFNEDMRTALGHTPRKIAQQLGELPVDVIGINCSLGPSGVLHALRNLAPHLPSGRFLSAQPNAGWPERIGGRIMYPATPEYFGEYALALVEAGARLVGGCCGTTPAHIAHMRQALDSPDRTVNLYRLPGESAEGMGPVSTVNPTRMAQRLNSGEFVVTVEVNPPKGFSAEKVIAGATMLKTAGANAINVADSPRARMRMSPWAVCHLIQNQVGLETVLHFPTRGRNILRVQGDLLAAHALNVRNIFAVMGDPTTIGDYPDALNDYDVVPTGLIKLLKQKFNTGVDHSGEPLTQPTNFLVGCALNLTPVDIDHELKVLRRKIESGADFALTQPVFNVAQAQAFMARYETEFGPWPLPLVAGVLPLYNGRHAEFLHNEIPGINIPADMRQRVNDAGERGAQVGIELAVELISQLRPFIQGIYLIPAFGRYELTAAVIEATLAQSAPA
jgi:homocysteine S-methyltransferase